MRTRIVAARYQYTLQNGDSEKAMDVDDVKANPKDRRTIRPILNSLVLLLASIGLLVLIVLVEQRDSGIGKVEAYPVDETICSTSKCEEISCDILKTMDTKVDPCTDMYSYACGGWMKEHTIPPGLSFFHRHGELYIANEKRLQKSLEDTTTMLRGQESTAIAKLKSHYRTCIDVETIDAKGATSAKEIIRSRCPWSITSDGNSTWDETIWSFQESLTASHAMASATFFSLSVRKDVKIPSQMMLMFQQSGLTLETVERYSNNQSEELKEAFIASATELGVLLGGERQEVRTKMEQVYNLEKNLSEIVENEEDVDWYNKMTLREFQDKIGSWIDIQRFVNTFYVDSPLPSSEKIVVNKPTYFKKLGGIIERTDKEVLANYITWRLLHKTLLRYMSDEFQATTLPLNEALYGITSLKDRATKCYMDANYDMSFALSALYVDKYFHNSSREQVESVLSRVNQQFIKNLDSVSWLDNTSRGPMLEKARSISYKIGYPDWMMDPNALDDYYQNITVKDGEYLKNAIRFIKFYGDLNVRKYRKPSMAANQWYMSPVSVNAYYRTHFNEIAILAGIFNPPFYSPYYPKSFLYGSMGSTAGHEITHGFDHIGRFFDKDGKLVDQWTNTTAQQFNERTKCMIEQYGNYTMNGQRMNGQVSLRENIADNGGFMLAYQAFKNDPSPDRARLPGLNLTDDQMFYLAYSQTLCGMSTRNLIINGVNENEHMPGRFRVEGVMANLPEFADVFNCPKDDLEVASNRCKVW